METTQDPYPSLHPLPASIGPRRFTRGNHTRSLSIPSSTSRFNWATEIYPWKPLWRAKQSWRTSSLQLGHGDLPVETPSPPSFFPLLPSFASIGPRRFTRGNWLSLVRSKKIARSFNWATEIYPWKHEYDRLEKRALELLQLGHGDLPVETVVPTPSWTPAARRFNWATEIYPWKLRRRGFPMSWRSCFNWATEIYPWKPPPVPPG